MKEMELKMNKLSGSEDEVRIEKMTMEDPSFESETVHVAHALFTNPKTSSFDYTAELYLGKVVGNKVSTSGAINFTILAGGSKSVDFSVNMPVLTIPDDAFHVYLEVKHLGTLLITFVATEDVAVYIIPAIKVTQITWD